MNSRRITRSALLAGAALTATAMFVDLTPGASAVTPRTQVVTAWRPMLASPAARAATTPAILAGQSIAPGAWSVRMVAGTAAAKDAQGQTWQPATGLWGGTTRTSTVAIHRTASPTLYKTMQFGASSWTIPLPNAGRYAVDVLLADTTTDKIGSDEFTVSAQSGTTTTTLATGVDIPKVVNKNNAYHITGMVNASSPTVKLLFTATAGSTMISGVKVTSDGVAAAPATLLDEGFAGTQGTAPDPAVWTNSIGTRYGGSGSQEGYTPNRQYSQLDGQGHLAISARHTPYSDTAGKTAPWTSARLVSKNKFSFGYGRVEASIKPPSGGGVWPAFWTLGTNEDQVGWPRCGEADIMEPLGRMTTLVAGHLHFPLVTPATATTGANYQPIDLGVSWFTNFDVTAAFHTYSMDYEPGFVTFYLDGAQYFTGAPEDIAAGEAWPFNGSQFYMILNLAIGSSNWPGYPDATTPAVPTMLVDRITVTS